jgi:hypothetical protein
MTWLNDLYPARLYLIERRAYRYRGNPHLLIVVSRRVRPQDFAELIRRAAA